MFSEAAEAFKDERYVQSLSVATKLLEIWPCHVGSFNLLVSVPDYLKGIDIKVLEAIATAIMVSFPEHDVALCNSGDVFVSTGNPQKAEAAFKQVLDSTPDHFRAHVGVGSLANRVGNLEAAEYHFRQAAYVQPLASRVLTLLAGVLSNLGRKSEAEHYLKVSYSINPVDPNTFITWAQMEESRGNIDAAWDLFSKAKKNISEESQLGLLQATLHRRSGDHRVAISKLDEINIGELQGHDAVNYYYERHRVLDKLKLYKQSFDNAEKANTIKRDELGYLYDLKQQDKRFEQLKKWYVSENLAKVDKPEVDLEYRLNPIFICGFTRSGTSMVEQILSAHSNIVGADELPFIYDCAGNLTDLTDARHAYPRGLFTGSRKQVNQRLNILRQRYRNRLSLAGVLTPGVSKFTDKMPMNEMHLGLIQCMFPHARVVHVFRHPLDSVLSSFFTDASHGDYCTFGLESAAHHYVRLFEMTEHYLANIDICYLRIRYEDILGNIKKETTRMLKFVDEKFEEECLNFHQNPRYSRTASYAQVKQKLYKSSRYRYRHYRKQVESIVPILDPVIKKLGYAD